jgi:hypothetical protein
MHFLATPPCLSPISPCLAEYAPSQEYAEEDRVVPYDAVSDEQKLSGCDAKRQAPKGG